MAAKVVVLCLLLCALLAGSLTVMGYRQASEGLNRQAQLSLGTDAQMTADALDAWNTQRLLHMEHVAAVPSVTRYLEALSNGRTPTAEEAQAARDALIGLDTVSKDLDSVALIPKEGKLALSSVDGEKGTDVTFRDYFTVPMKEGKAFITGVTVSTLTGKPVIFHAFPVKGSDGKIVGVVRSRATLDFVSEVVQKARNRLGDGSMGILLDENGLVLASMNAAWASRPIVPLNKDVLDSLVKGKRWGNGDAPEPIGEKDLIQSIGVTKATTFDWNSGGVLQRSLAVPLRLTKWSYVAAMPVATFQASADAFLRNALLTAIVAMLIASLAAVFLARGIAGQATRLARQARRLAEGDISNEVVVDSRDEMGRIAEAFGEVIVSQRHMVAVARAIAEGDLSQEVTPRGEADVLGHAFQKMIVNLRQMVTSVASSSASLAQTSSHLSVVSSQAGVATSQIASTIQQVAGGNQEHSALVQDSSDSMEQLVRAIDQISSGAKEQARSVERVSASVARLHASVARRR